MKKIKKIYIKKKTFLGLEFIYSQRGRPLLVLNNYLYRKNRKNYWRCIRCTKYKCKSRLIMKPDKSLIDINGHTHGPETGKIKWGRSIKSTLEENSLVLNNAPLEILNDLMIPKAIKLPIRQPHFNTDPN